MASLHDASKLCNAVRSLVDYHIQTCCIYSWWNLSSLVSALQEVFEIWAGPEQLHYGAWDILFLLDKEAMWLYSHCWKLVTSKSTCLLFSKSESPWVDCSRLRMYTGTAATCCAHIITAVIGSGVLSLGWALAQVGHPVHCLLDCFSYTNGVCRACHQTAGWVIMTWCQA